MNEMLKSLKSLPKEFLHYIIYQLMLDGNITYHELMDMHIKHLKELEKGSSDAYMRLQGMITHMYHDSKKNRDANLKGIMHQLVDDGRINMTHEQIDKK